MSYILDALKKSEQARLNVDTPLQQLLLRAEAVREPRRVWPYVAGAALLLNLGALYAWWRSTAGSSVEQPVLASPAVKPAPAAVLEGAPAPLPTALPIRGAREAAATAAMPPHDGPAQEKPVPTPAAPAAAEREPVPAAKARATPPAPAGEPVAAAPKAPRAQPSVPAVAPAEPSVPAATTEAAKAAGGEHAALDLPEAIRRELPPLVVSGVVREAGTSGWVVVNERPLREGDELVPGLKVEKILERGAQFSYKGHRFQR